MTSLPVISERAPAKPRKGEQCNGCGFCCAAELCDLAVECGFASAPCPAMEFFAGRFWCGLASNPLRYFPKMPPANVEPMRVLIATGLGFGRGCDADDPIGGVT